MLFLFFLHEKNSYYIEFYKNETNRNVQFKKYIYSTIKHHLVSIIPIIKNNFNIISTYFKGVGDAFANSFGNSTENFIAVYLFENISQNERKCSFPYLILKIQLMLLHSDE